MICLADRLCCAWSSCFNHSYKVYTLYYTAVISVHLFTDTQLSTVMIENEEREVVEAVPSKQFNCTVTLSSPIGPDYSALSTIWVHFTLTQPLCSQTLESSSASLASQVTETLVPTRALIILSVCTGWTVICVTMINLVPAAVAAIASTSNIVGTYKCILELQ